MFTLSWGKQTTHCFCRENYTAKIITLLISRWNVIVYDQWIDVNMLLNPWKNWQIFFVKVDRHPQFKHSRCLFVVRTDGGWIDFSYQKCLRAYIRDKYPLHAERFIREHLKRNWRFINWSHLVLNITYEDPASLSYSRWDSSLTSRMNRSRFSSDQLVCGEPLRFLWHNKTTGFCVVIFYHIIREGINWTYLLKK